ncbi:hypothetical protein [Streptomyces sp. NPDC004533]|uniref:hypothetical protein n=1 Tax=Streptomyces sp. NPDC004533 TaxID=3154278 RepID=UPI0033AE22A2
MQEIGSVMVSTVFAVKPDDHSLWEHDSEQQWHQISAAPTGEIIGGYWGLVSTNRDTGDLWSWHGDENAWLRMSGPSGGVAVTARAVYSVQPEDRTVYGTRGADAGNGETSWNQVATDPTGQIYGGGYDDVDLLVSTNPFSGELFLYQGTPGDWKNDWKRISGPSGGVAITANTIYSLTTDRSSLYSYDVRQDSWTRIAGPTGQIYGGEWGLVSTNPQTGDLFRYRGNRDDWEMIGEGIGGPGNSFAVERSLYRSCTNPGPDSGVYKYDESDKSWTKIGPVAESITTAYWEHIS